MSRRRIALLSLTAFALLAPAAEGAMTTTRTFNFTGAEQVFTVPVGVGTINVHAVGGSGGCTGSQIGRGGDVTANLTVIPGQVLYVEVGGNGATNGTGGFNGGGAGGRGGGGASDVRTAPAAAGGSLDTRQVVAGGGGGGGTNNTICGGDAGNTRGGSASAAPGGAGTLVSGGSGGASSGTCATNGGNGTSGGFGVGGAGGPLVAGCTGTGGGGGGGYYGGGGGGAGAPVAAGGGGGSNAAPGDSLAVLTGIDTTGVPKVEITCAVPTADVSPADITFPGTQALGTTSSPQVLTITNNGSAPLVVSGIILTGNDATDFFVGSSNCGGTIAVGDSCEAGVRFAPQASGLRDASLHVQSNAPSEPSVVPLSGTGGELPTGPTGPTGPAGAPGPPGVSRLIALFAVSKAAVRRGRTLRLPFAATAAGTAKLALRKGTKTLATATRTLADAGRGTLSVSGRRTRKLTPGRYTLQLTFTAPTADRPATDTIKLAVKR